MLEDGGHWLKLMRTATLPTDANICLRISGRELVCTVTKDVNKEVELKVTCRFSDTCHEQELDISTPPESELLKSPEAPKLTEVKLEEPDIVPTGCTSPQVMFDSVPNSVCGYSDTATSSSSFRSREVSEERSLKSENIESDINMDDFKEETPKSEDVQGSPSSDTTPDAKNKKEEKLYKTRQRIESASKDNVACHSPEHDAGTYHHETQRRQRQDSAKSTSGLTNPKSFCEACKIQFMSVNTYQVHKKIYCKSRHESEELMTLLDGTSVSLSNAFKPSGDTVILSRGGVSTSVIQPQAIYAAISTNPLILLPCTLVPGQGLVPQNNVIPTGPSGMLLQNGMLCATTVDKTVAKSSDDYFPVRKTSHPVMNVGDEHKDSTLLSGPKIATLKRKISEGGVLNLKKVCVAKESDDAITPEKETLETNDTVVEQDSPLDLSVKVKTETGCFLQDASILGRRSVISSVHPSSPVHHASGTTSPPGHIISSSVHGASSPTNSHSNENVQPSTHLPTAVHRISSVVTERLSPLPPVLQSAIIEKPMAAPGTLPPKLMKQGNNICDECHIVFIKYDNLVTHKKFYCAYRRRQLSAMAAAAEAAEAQENLNDDNSNHSGANESPPDGSNDESKSGLRKSEYDIEQHYRSISKTSQPVYLCDACGVRFSTSDTLVAHQTYYCMKKPDSAMSKAINKKCEDSSSPPTESPFSGPEEWKCNFCDAAGSSYETIRRHLLTHSEPRGYRCLLCGYKGNTLRSMRTHASDHLSDDATASIEEFMASTVIGETGPVPFITNQIDDSDGDSDSPRESIAYNNRIRTSSNNSDNVRTVKREKLAADISESEEMSDSPRSFENVQKDPRSKVSESTKIESGDSNSNTSGHPEAVNPLSFCDVVIKTENTSGNDSDRSDGLKSENDQDNENKSPVDQHQSVIRVAEKHITNPQRTKCKNKFQVNLKSDMKSCKSCGVSFQHMSNLLTHKKYYCVSRSLQNCIPETATVQ